MKSDWEYLIEAKKGDDKSAEYIFNKYYTPLVRMTFLIIGSIDSAHDIVQETFIRLAKKNIKHMEGNFKSYLTTIAYRLALKEKYRNKRIIGLDSIIDRGNWDGQIRKYEELETQKSIFDAIQDLDENKKEILVLRFYGGHSYEEIAEITGIPLGTVKSRIFYAVKECGTKLREKEILE